MKTNHILHIAMLCVVMLMGRCNPHGHGASLDLTGTWKGPLLADHVEGRME